MPNNFALPSPAAYYQVMRSFLLFLLLLTSPLAISAEPFSATVIHIWDGDSLVISTPEGPRQIRIFGIDAPEKTQPFNDQARQYLQQLILNQEVLIEEIDQDNYKRMVAKITLREQDIASMMVTAGFAWVFHRYNRDPKMLELEKKAKKEKRGLWQQNSPTAPWIWRKQH